MQQPEQQPESLAGKTVLAAIARTEVGDGVASASMTVFPVFGPPADSPLVYYTLAESIEEGWVVVAERPSATVPELELKNQGTALVFILDGEEIVGGRQNRIANASYLIAPEMTVSLPVSCVEHGRWHPTAAHFSSGETANSSLRRAKEEQVKASLRHSSAAPAAARLAPSARYSSDQGAVWDSVAETQAALAVPSRSGALHDVYESRRASLTDYDRAFPYPKNATGLIVAIGGRFAGAELFDQPRTAQILWPKLVRSYALDALTQAPGTPVDRSRAVRLLARTAHARCEVYPSLALGEDVRLEGDGVFGAALVYHGAVVHASVFRDYENRKSSGATPGVVRSAVRRLMRDRL